MKRFLGLGGGKSSTNWLVIGGVAGALYFILLDKSTGISPIDQLLQGIGGATGIEGRGKGFIPDYADYLPGNMTGADDTEPPIDQGKVAADAGMSLNFGNAYLADRLTLS